MGLDQRGLAAAVLPDEERDLRMERQLLLVAHGGERERIPSGGIRTCSFWATRLTRFLPEGVQAPDLDQGFDPATRWRVPRGTFKATATSRQDRPSARSR